MVVHSSALPAVSALVVHSSTREEAGSATKESVKTGLAGDEEASFIAALSELEKSPRSFSTAASKPGLSSEDSGAGSVGTTGSALIPVPE